MTIFRKLLVRGANALTRGLLALPLVWALTLGEAAAQNAIEVLVNDKAITTYDINQRTKMLQVFTRGRQGRDDAVEQLIDERLMLQEAELRGVTVGDAEIEQEFARRARQANMSASQFEQAMRQAGFDPQTFRNFMRANMAWRQIVQRRFRATEQITEQDVTAALGGRDEEGEQVTASEYMLQAILFLVPPGSGGGLEAQRRGQAVAFRDAFQGCDQSLQQAGGTPGIVVKPTVRREQAQLSPELKEALGGLEVGGVAGPDKVPEGFQLLAVCAKNEITGQTEATLEVREELSSERGTLLARRYLRDLRSDAVIEYR